MAGTSVHGAIHRESSGGRPNLTRRNPPPPPPLSPSDLISPLPDAVIHHIFTFLPLKDVVKTSVLSKRWRSTWTSTTHLVFDGRRPRSPLDFSSRVDSVLIQCTSPAVKIFHIILKYDEAYRPKLDLWLRFAEQRHVEDLCLGLFTQLQVFYLLPRFLYCLSWLVRLEVRFCCFPLGSTIRWPCLKVLLIKYAKLSDEILEGIVRGSPALESLELFGCWGVKNIRIDSTSVKELILVNDGLCNPEKIWAPRLPSLQVSGFWHCDSVFFRLDDVSSLMEAKLDFVVAGDKRMVCDLLKELFEKLHGVLTFTIGGWCLQILSILEMKGVPSPLSKCQNLILSAPVSQWDLPGIAYMLGSSQCLQKLVIHLTGLPLMQLGLDEESTKCCNFDKEDFLHSRKGHFQCLAQHLKRVEIVGFEANSLGSKHLLAVIKFLLGDALALEKMIIKAELLRQHGQKCLQATVLSKLLGVSQNVLSYRRDSKNAEVIFDYAFK